MKSNSCRKSRKSSVSSNRLGKILIADDEEMFLNSTADLLRREGFICDCVADANEAILKLKSNEYDALIADIRMPGNPNLEFIKALPRLAEGLSAILVTGFPSQHTAIDSIGLPVVAYMVKPADFDALLENILKAVDRTRLFRSVSKAQKTLEAWQEGLANLDDGIKRTEGGRKSFSERNFVDLTFAGVFAALSDIKYIVCSPSKEKAGNQLCHLSKCPRVNKLVEAVEETIEVLEKTKSSFKSSELGKIRGKLEKIAKKNRTN